MTWSKVKVTSAWKPPKRSRPSVPHGTNFFSNFFTSLTYQLQCFNFWALSPRSPTGRLLSPILPNLLYHFQKRSAAVHLQQRGMTLFTQKMTVIRTVCGKKKEEYSEESNESTFIEVHCFHCMILIWKSIKMILVLQPWALLVTLRSTATCEKTSHSSVCHFVHFVNFWKSRWFAKLSFYRVCVCVWKQKSAAMRNVDGECTLVYAKWIHFCFNLFTCLSSHFCF